jgi:hypothetical protein
VSETCMPRWQCSIPPEILQLRVQGTTRSCSTCGHNSAFGNQLADTPLGTLLLHAHALAACSARTHLLLLAPSVCSESPPPPPACFPCAPCSE